MVVFNAVTDALRDWVYGFFGIDIIMRAIAANEPIPAQGYLQVIYSTLTSLFGLFCAYNVIYFVIGLFAKSRHYPEAKKDKRYAFLIPAHNEEKVIANALEGILALDYPKELVDIYVCADNCTDETAKIAASYGAKVYVHTDPNQKMKGYALAYLVGEMKKENVLDGYYALIVSDADTIHAPDYLSRMNDCLQATGADAATAYRNSKNVSENWVAAMCGIQDFQGAVAGARPRSILKTNQVTIGACVAFRSYLFQEKGWEWTLLTEDLQGSTDLACQDKKTAWSEDAMIYFEQPTDLRAALSQRFRWAKGSLVVFHHYWRKLFRSFFKKPTWAKYDLYWNIVPSAFCTFWLGLLYNVANLILYFVVGGAYYTPSNFLNYVLTLFGGTYLSFFVIDLIILIREWKHFLIPVWKAALYTLLFPLFNVISPFIYGFSIFYANKWKPIQHHSVEESQKLRDEEKAKLERKKKRG